MSGVFTIPADRCFVTTLAEGLWRRVEADPLRLAEMEVYLPTRRACRALREAFLRVTDAHAALLPRLRPLGDVDDTDFVFADSAALGDLPPAITPLRRQMLLTQMIAAKDKSLPLDQATALALTLGALLDQAQTASLDFAQLPNLVPAGTLAQHWQETLQFLEIVTAAWPAILAAEGCMDPAARRVAVLDRQAQLWSETKPDHPIIAAGSTGSVPAVARLMKAIAGLPRGEVILPALDLSLDEDGWQAVSETHPQFTMKAWLETATVKREEVKEWEGSAVQNAPRVRLLQETMCPAEVSDRWQKLTAQDIPPNSIQGLEALALDHMREEAEVIALRLRGALEEAGKTAALVTPDRALAARVAAALTRWGIAVNDSAGAPLDALPVGRFLVEAIKAAAKSADPIDYLTLLKHPLTAAGIAPVQAQHYTRMAEEKVWRGVRRTDGL
ncbi:MAG TPA: double-strand break repair protein AddB, partial [Rhodospirillaceae bacterium]|nr:double-strand break repair protein AddB [Rhodospirillaceae bacterium]